MGNDIESLKKRTVKKILLYGENIYSKNVINGSIDHEDLLEGVAGGIQVPQCCVEWREGWWLDQQIDCVEVWVDYIG